MKGSTLSKFVIAGAVVLALAGGAIAAYAASNPSAAPSGAPSGSAKPRPYCTDFINHLAQDLGTTSSQVTSAMKEAASQTIQDAVTAGALTTAQGQKLEKALGNANVCSAALRSATNRAKARRFVGLAVYLKASAAALGITPQQLRTDLRDGMSLSQIAQSRSITEAQFRSGLISVLKPVLDKAVAAHKISAARENAVLHRLQTGPLPLWNRPANRAQPHETASAAA